MTELEALREEIKSLRDEVARLRIELASHQQLSITYPQVVPYVPYTPWYPNITYAVSETGAQSVGNSCSALAAN